MLTIEKLNEYGANTAEGLARCFNNEAFYLKLVRMGMTDPGFDRLRDAVESGDAAKAFEACHALKGAMGNLALTPIYEPACALTEQLRGAREMGDVSAQYGRIMDAVARLRALAE